MARSVTISVDPATYDWLRRMAEDNSESVAEIVRGCIRDAQAIDRGEFVMVPAPSAAAAPEADHG